MRDLKRDLQTFDLIGEGDWTPQDVIGHRNTENLISAEAELERLREENKQLREIEEAARELVRRDLPFETLAERERVLIFALAASPSSAAQKETTE